MSRSPSRPETCQIGPTWIHIDNRKYRRHHIADFCLPFSGSLNGTPEVPVHEMKWNSGQWTYWGWNIVE
ncbi:hypothetical protein SCLCIDRAFT_1225075 [Scleroderma citrinum Foug A]|uniref:Uncharacterized protein n=1 Tax=Scleroderma citrinum Foug A TaxID=1036808 RepID=A0A0C3D415_9AGAM|nr:hypothetical protein SCLCIDRAFT_1225075 [Scleroderma citrinum Foug A]